MPQQIQSEFISSMMFRAKPRFFQRLRAVLHTEIGENASDLVRTVVLREIERREREGQNQKS